MSVFSGSEENDFDAAKARNDWYRNEYAKNDARANRVNAAKANIDLLGTMSSKELGAWNPSALINESGYADDKANKDIYNSAIASRDSLLKARRETGRGGTIFANPIQRI